MPYNNGQNLPFNLFADVRREDRRLKPYEAGGRPMSQGGKYARGIYDIQGAPIGHDLVLNRSLTPDTRYVYGEDKRPLGHTPGPYTVEAQPLPNYGPHRPIWRGWRPKRPVASYKQIGIEMPIPQRGTKFESAVPSEASIIDWAENEAQVPGHPIAPMPDMIPDPYRDYGIYVEDKEKGVVPGELGDLGYKPGATDLPAGPPGAPPQPDLLQQATGIDITALSRELSQAYAGGKAEEIAEAEQRLAEARYRAGMGPKPGEPVKPPGPELPWGTIVTVGAVALAAMFILPKVLK